MSDVPTAAGGVTVVGLAEMSATVVRTRLLAAHDRFWDTDTRALHSPVWFHQFGGFGAVALDDVALDDVALDDVALDGAGLDVGYVLGVVTADGLAYLHLLAVRDDRRRTGLGRRLCAWFDEVAVATGARAVQTVTRPDDSRAIAFHTALGASAHLSRDHAGPGQDRLVLTRRPAR